MKFGQYIFLLIISFFLFPFLLLAENIPEQTKIETSCDIIAPDYVKRSENINLNNNIYNLHTDPNFIDYFWFIDGKKFTESKLDYNFINLGKHTIQFILKDKNGKVICEKVKEIQVVEKIYLFFYDEKLDLQKVSDLKEFLKTKNIQLLLYKVDPNNFSFDLLESNYNLSDLDALILSSKDLHFYNVFFDSIQEVNFNKYFKGDFLYFVSFDEYKNLNILLNNIANYIPVKYLINLESLEYLKNLLISQNPIKDLYNLKAKHFIFDKSKQQEYPWYRFLSKIINNLLKNGVALQYIWILLVLILIATIIVFSRQFIGINALGIYTPTLLALSFLLIGFTKGVVIFAVLLLVSALVRKLSSKFNLLYLSKMALSLITITLLLFIMLNYLVFWSWIILDNNTILAIVIMLILSEKFLAVHFENKSKKAWLLTVETIFLSFISYLIVSWDYLRIFVLAYPEVLLLTFVVNFYLGRWRSLRLLEYFRFYRVIHREMENEDFSVLLKH